MQVHFDVLGWLHVLAGWIGSLTGLALLLLAAGTNSLDVLPGEARAGVVMWLLLLTGAVMAGGGALMIVTGHGLVARWPKARVGALLLAVPGLCALPFGTALGIYTIWTLLNDDARGAFGRRLRGPSAA